MGFSFTKKNSQLLNPLSKNWHQLHLDFSTSAGKIADRLARIMGSWGFIFWQTIFVILWLGANLYGLTHEWDPYPFVLLNLVFAVQAAYAAPIIMMTQNRQSDRDRIQAEADYKTNRAAKKEIDELQEMIKGLEKKLDKVLAKGKK